MGLTVWWRPVAFLIMETVFRIPIASKHGSQCKPGETESRIGKKRTTQVMLSLHLLPFLTKGYEIIVIN